MSEDEHELNEIRPLDVGRAARMALASQNHDSIAMGLVLDEAAAEDTETNEGIIRLISALAAGYGVMAASVSPDDTQAPLLRLMAAVQDLE